MIRVTGPGAPTRASGTKKTQSVGGGFKVGAGASAAPGASGAGAAAPAATLSALIALQSADPDTAQGRAKRIAAAQRVLEMLDEVRLGLLQGADGAGLDALEQAAGLADVARAGADESLAGLIDEIALRARVELAKRGR